MRRRRSPGHREARATARASGEHKVAAVLEGADDDLSLGPSLRVTAPMSNGAVQKFGLKATDIEKDYHITRLLADLCQPGRPDR